MISNILVELRDGQTKKDLEKTLPCFSVDYKIKDTQIENTIEVSFDNSQTVKNNLQNETPKDIIKRYILDNGFNIAE